MVVWGKKVKVKVVHLCPTPCNSYSPWNSLGQNTGVGSLSLLQGILPIQGSNPGLLHCRRVLYQLSYQGSPLTIFIMLQLFFFYTNEENKKQQQSPD